jgi:hypothetical protein
VFPVQSAEYAKLREYAAVLPDVDLTDLAVFARDLVEADPEHDRVQRLNEVIDLMVAELWGRLQDRLARWRSKQQQTVEQFTLTLLTETLQGLKDSDLKSYTRATRTAMLRSSDESERARYRLNRQISLSIMRARAKAKQLLKGLRKTRARTNPKLESWKRQES